MLDDFDEQVIVDPLKRPGDARYRAASEIVVTEIEFCDNLRYLLEVCSTFGFG